MVDELETAPLPDPVPGPAPDAAPAPVPAPVPAPAAVPVPAVAAAPAPAPAPASHGRRNRRLGLAAQVAGIVGIVVCLALAAGVLLGRGWATDTVSTVTTNIDTKLAQAVPLLDTASTKVSEVAGRVGAVADAANALAGRPAPSNELLQGLMGAVTNVSDRYLELRASYGELRQTAVAALDGLQTLDRMIPGFSVPQGPVDALTKLDAAVTELDAKIMGMADAIPASGPIDMAATAIATKVGEVEAKLQGLVTVIDDAQARLAEVRTQLATTTDTIKTTISIGSLVLVLLLAWVAVLHWVLFRTGRRLRAETTGS
jgi:hypothetical protein